MAREQLQWTSPAPFWPSAAGATDTDARRTILRQPAILRFATDTFMDNFLQMLETDPAQLPEFVAKPETWRGPTIGPAPPKQVPAFARSLSRLGLAAARKKQTASGLVSGTAAAISLTGSPEALPPPAPLKLYQPAHQRYYLVASCLVCGRAGLPDRAVNPARQERVGFVVRRLLPQNYKEAATDSRGLPVPLPQPDNSWDEYALVTAAAGHGWRKVTKTSDGGAAVLLEGEELLRLFPAQYEQDDGNKRRIFGGLVPVGKREAYMGAPLLPPSQATTITSAATGPAIPGADAGAPDAPVDPRLLPLWLQVTEPWKRLLETADRLSSLQGAPDPFLSRGETIPAADNAKWIKGGREQIQTGSWYILLDFTKYLAQYLPDVWKVVLGEQPESSLVNKVAEGKVLSALKTTALPNSLMTALATPARYQGRVKATLVDALRAIKTENAEGPLERVAGSYDRDNPDPNWPGFLFPFADPTLSPIAGPLPAITIPTVSGEKPIDTAGRRIDALANLIQSALPAQPPLPESALPLVAQRPLDMREGWFQLRCVYDRPECGPIDPPLVSAPTAPFQMANFFDPDAPARPIRIALPLDTSPGGLRKFDKNAAFVMSDMLCGQVNRMKGISLADLVLSVLPWPLHKDLSVPDAGPCGGGGVGMICSLSIPIITICALLLLMIIVSLLDFIFRWLPFFLICFPLPGLSAGKKQGA